MEFTYDAREVFAGGKVIGHIVSLKAKNRNGETVRSRVLRGADAADFLAGVNLSKSKDAVEWLVGTCLPVE